VEIIQEELLVDDHASVSPENEIEIDASIDLEQKEEAEISELKENIAAPEVAPPSHMPDEPLAQVQLPQNDDVDIADDNWVHIYPTLSPTYAFSFLPSLFVSVSQTSK
jgi:Trk K+ transport system NAD-binding subunit